jgi:hypothetical protein
MTDRIEQFWRDATAEDVARVMKGEKVEARFRDYDHADWTEFDLLGGFATSVNYPVSWFDVCGVRWFQCQVYEPPQWWLEKPNPGEGWRLLEKFPGEPKLATDEFFDTFNNKWTQVGDTGSIQYHGVWYRRRIEPAKQDAGSTSASNIPKGWTALSDDEPRLASDAYWSQDPEAWVIIGNGWMEAANREKWPAIRQRKFVLVQGESYSLPQGLTLEVYKQGFEVF